MITLTIPRPETPAVPAPETSAVIAPTDSSERALTSRLLAFIFVLFAEFSFPTVALTLFLNVFTNATPPTEAVPAPEAARLSDCASTVSDA